MGYRLYKKNGRTTNAGLSWLSKLTNITVSGNSYYDLEIIKEMFIDGADYSDIIRLCEVARATFLTYVRSKAKIQTTLHTPKRLINKDLYFTIDAHFVVSKLEKKKRITLHFVKNLYEQGFDTVDIEYFINGYINHRTSMYRIKSGF